MASLSPGELLDKTGTPRRLKLEALPLSDLARDHKLALRGPDLAIRSLLPLSLLVPGEHSLTYLSSADYASVLKEGAPPQAVSS